MSQARLAGDARDSQPFAHVQRREICEICGLPSLAPPTLPRILLPSCISRANGGLFASTLVSCPVRATAPVEHGEVNHRFHRFGISLGLGRIDRFVSQARLAGDARDSQPFAHVQRCEICESVVYLLWRSQDFLEFLCRLVFPVRMVGSLQP